MPGRKEQLTETPQALQTVSDVDKAVAISAALLACSGAQFETRILQVDYTGRLGRRGPFRHFAEIRFTLHSEGDVDARDDQVKALQAVNDEVIATAIAASIGKLTGEKYLGFVALRNTHSSRPDREIANIMIQLAATPEAN